MLCNIHLNNVKSWELTLETKKNKLKQNKLANNNKNQKKEFFLIPEKLIINLLFLKH